MAQILLVAVEDKAHDGVGGSYSGDRGDTDDANDAWVQEFHDDGSFLDS